MKILCSWNAQQCMLTRNADSLELKPKKKLKRDAVSFEINDEMNDTRLNCSLPFDFTTWSNPIIMIQCARVYLRIPSGANVTTMQVSLNDDGTVLNAGIATFYKTS